MVMSALVTIPIAALFLAVGSTLWVVFGGDVGAAQVAGEIAAAKGLRTPAQGFDFIFPHYVVASLPVGVRGAIIAGILAGSMGSLDSAISALASTGVKNVWQVYFQRDRDDAQLLHVSRWLSISFGAAIIGVAVWVWFAEETGGAQAGFGVLMLGLKVLSWVFPPLLGIFLVGVLTTRGRDLGNLLAVTAGVGVLLTVEVWPRLFGSTAPFAWTWNALIGCAIAFGVSVLFPAPARVPAPALARAA
jgi:Na+/proline symporter